jgi:tetratricopeptide (TPR) repeat protein
MLARAYEMEKNTRIRRLEIAQATSLAVGKMYVLRGQREETLAVYSEAISAMPKQSLFYVEKAGLLLQMREYDDVEKLLARIYELKLTNIDQYDYSLRQIEKKLEQHLGESSGS